MEEVLRSLSRFAPESGPSLGKRKRRKMAPAINAGAVRRMYDQRHPSSEAVRPATNGVAAIPTLPAIPLTANARPSRSKWSESSARPEG